MNRLFLNKKPVVYGIGVFVIALLVLFAFKARADQTLEFEAGSALVRGETPAVGITIACKLCGPVSTDYEIGFDLIGESEHRQHNPNNIQVRAQIVDGYKNVELGIGFYYQNQPGEYVCGWGFHLLARYWISGRFAVQWRHSSSAGSCDPNAGRDLLTIGYRF